MKNILPISFILTIFLALVPHAFATTQIKVSNNGSGSSNSVKVHNSTSSNDGSTTSTTKVVIDGKVVVDEKKEGNSNTDISVKKEGDAEPTVIINSQPQTITPGKSHEEIQKEIEAKKAEVEKKIEEKKAEAEKRMNAAITKHEVKKQSLFTKMEDLFSRLRSIFGS